MFNEQVTIILYANDVAKYAAFWEKLGFVIISQNEIDGSPVAEIAVVPDGAVHFMIYDRTFIENNSDEVSEPSPALIFSSNDVMSLYKNLQEKGIPLGDLTQIGGEYVFNFVDIEGNYFVVSGK